MIQDYIPTQHLLDITTSRDINRGHFPMYTLGFNVSEDDLTAEERELLEQSKIWKSECLED